MGSFLWVSESFPGTRFLPNPKMPPHQDISFVTPVLFFLKPEITNHLPEFTDVKKRIVCCGGTQFPAKYILPIPMISD